jgi:hypothetical protein
VKKQGLSAGAGAINFDAFKPEQGYVLCLKSLPPTLVARGGFKWPESGHVSAPDWKPTKKIGNGLHAFMWGEGYARFGYLDDDAMWLVLKVRKQDIIELDGMVKFPEAEVLFCGARDIAVYIVAYHAPAGTAVMFANVTVGDYATVIGGDCSTVTGGNHAKVRGGDYAIATGGDYATVKVGDYSTATGGDFATVKGGDFATATGGYRSPVTVGACATATGGASSTVSGGIGARVSGGGGAVLILEYVDENKSKKKAVVVDGKKILPYVKYRLNKKHELVRAD